MHIEFVRCQGAEPRPERRSKTKFASLSKIMLAITLTLHTKRSVRAFHAQAIRRFRPDFSTVDHRVHRLGDMRLFGSQDEAEQKDPAIQNRETKKKKKKPHKKQKVKYIKEITQEHLDRLAAAFDELARKDGFDSSTAKYADDATFEDEFDLDAMIARDELEEEFQDQGSLDDIDSPLNANEVLGLFDDGGGNHPNESSDGGRVNPADDMDARIAAAMAGDRIEVPEHLDRFAQTATDEQLAALGFKREENPFGNDETSRRDQFQLITDAMTCPACGSPFQSTNSNRPGYLPPEKYEIQVKLSKLEEMQKLQAKADKYEWSPEDEIEYLIQTSDGDVNSDEFDEMATIDLAAMAEELGLDMETISEKKVICKRCHGLQNYGTVEEVLRPGWTEEPLLSQSKFRELLAPLSQKPCVIIALIDLFDFGGSVLTELDSIAGENPVLLAANKADLLPAKMGHHRAENWVRRELEYMGIKSIANVGGAVRLVSCKTGFGISQLMQKARDLAEEVDGDVYIVGAANAGKSTLMNFILEKNSSKRRWSGKKRAGNATARRGALTVSPLPGTTLDFIKVDLGDGRSMYDTPGLLVPGTLTQKLTPEELKIVVPKK